MRERWNQIQAKTNNNKKKQKLNFTTLPVIGAEQEKDTEGDGTCPDDSAGRVHSGHGATAAADAAEAASGTHAAAAPDGARKPRGVQQPAAERTAQETLCGAAAAAQKPQGVPKGFSLPLWSLQ